MAYPTGMLSLTLEDVDRRASSVKSYAQRRRDEMAAGSVPSTTILDLAVRLKQDKDALSAAAAVPGIVAYAQSQKDDGTLDVVAEFNAMISAIDGVVNWIATNFPKDGSGFLLARTLGPNGPIDRQFASAQTAGLRTALDSLIATIS